MSTEILTLPVYRLSREKYYIQRSSYIEKTMYGGSKEHVDFQKEFHRRNPERKFQYETHLINKYGGCWEFNEIVGFIRLHFLGSQIRGEYFSVKAKRITRTRKKIFEYSTHKLAPELNIGRDASNQEIFKVVSKYVADCYKELPKGRFIDDGQLKSLGSFLDWRALLKSSTDFGGNYE
ncbi:hypothetical protein [Marinomonas aquiplantarum]|uniref:Uncharacterized protein n=1 Tax=Marinomonas aquiplantarum TaxID=491951 RepID=A0A366D838_9GAMM|nr:hypothetical protein [Marinomonas aquiplantarum]RBO86200.1 hypothetical protein DFP76_101477 [Marinomonas aquiplantarum]